MPGKCGGFPTRKPRNHPPHTPLPLPCPIQCPLFFGKSTSSAPSISRVRRLSCSSNRFPIQRKSFTAAAFSFVFLNHRPPPAPQLGPRDVFTPCCTPLTNHAFLPLRCSQPACRTRQSSRRHRATAIKMAARSDAPDICTQYARYLEVEAAVWCLFNCLLCPGSSLLSLAWRRWLRLSDVLPESTSPSPRAEAMLPRR